MRMRKLAGLNLVQAQPSSLRHFCQPDSSGLPEGLLDQRFERWVRARK
jgi:hypothetical protein